jgi:hypothetical protein
VEECADPTVAALDPPVEGDEKNVKLYGGNINFIVNDIDNATSTV